jgi:hypothetical protein
MLAYPIFEELPIILPSENKDIGKLIIQKQGLGTFVPFANFNNTRTTFLVDVANK